MTRRSDRRHFEIIGVLAELPFTDSVLSDVVSNALRRNHVGVVNDLLWLEGQGRVVRERGMHVSGSHTRSFWRLPTDAERGAR